jgi:hypothetical protein
MTTSETTPVVVPVGALSSAFRREADAVTDDVQAIKNIVPSYAELLDLGDIDGPAVAVAGAERECGDSERD